nr:unnamed protein product [Naegleria fowleri]
MLSPQKSLLSEEVRPSQQNPTTTTSNEEGHDEKSNKRNTTRNNGDVSSQFGTTGNNNATPEISLTTTSSAHANENNVNNNYYNNNSLNEGEEQSSHHRKGETSKASPSTITHHHQHHHLLTGKTSKAKEAISKHLNQGRRPSFKSPNIAITKDDNKDVGAMYMSPLTSHTFPYLFTTPDTFVSEHIRASGAEDFKRSVEEEASSSDDETKSDVEKRDSIELPKDDNERLLTEEETPSTITEKPEEPRESLVSEASSQKSEGGGNIRDILKGKLSFEEYGKHFFIIGLGFNCYRFDSVKDMLRHISKEDKDDEAFWIDCQQCSPEEVNELQKYFGFHPLTAEDCINNDSGEKWEVFDNYLFFSITGQIADKVAMNEYLPCYLNILIFDRCILTIHDKPIEGMDLLMNRIEKEFEFDQHYNQKIRAKHSFREQQEVIEEIHSILENTAEKQAQPLSKPGGGESPLRLRKGRTKKSTYIISPSWVFYAYLDAIIDVYIPKVDDLTRECDTLDEFTVSLNTSEKEDLLWRIALNKRRTVVLRKLLLPKQKMITYLVSPRVEVPFMDREVQLFLRDVLDHLIYCCDRLEMARDSLNQSHTNYLTRVQIEIAQNSQKTDAFMNRITVFASIFGPLSVLSGIWGMNVKVPGQDQEGLYWFFGLCAFMVIIALVIIALLRKQLVNMYT